jgi:hypothetical protein
MISKNEQNKTKKICDYNGNMIGELKNMVKYNSKANDTSNYKLTMHQPKCILTKQQVYKLFYIQYKCDPFLSDTKNELEDKDILLDVNCINITLDLNITINGHKFHDYLINNSYISCYNPDIYSGIKFIFKYPLFYENIQCDTKQPINGLCSCTTKCTCSNITFLIFQTGKVIVTGFKTLNEIEPIVSIFKNIFELYLKQNKI